MRNGLLGRLASKISRGVNAGLVGMSLSGLSGCNTLEDQYQRGEISYSDYQAKKREQDAALLSLTGGILGGLGAQRGQPGAAVLGRAVSAHGSSMAGRSEVRQDFYGQSQSQPVYIAKLVPEIIDSHICRGNCFGMDRKCDPSTLFDFQNTRIGELIKINAFAYFENARGVPTRTILNNEDDKTIWVQDEGPNPYVEFNRMAELYLKRNDNDKGMKQYAVKWYGNGEFISQSNFFINWGN